MEGQSYRRWVRRRRNRESEHAIRALRDAVLNPVRPPQLPLNLVLLKNIAITGIHWGAYAKNEPQRIPEVWKDLLQFVHSTLFPSRLLSHILVSDRLMESGRVKPVTYSETYKLENLADGLKAIEQRKTWGKAIVQVREEREAQPKSKL